MFVIQEEVQIILSIFLTSLLSGVLGMGGGMILMLILCALLPVREAMILHGITQLSSNLFRTLIHRKKIEFSILKPYFFGSLIVLFLFYHLQFMAEKKMILIILGICPFLSLLPKVSNLFDITKKGRAFTCGLFITLTQLTAGASGALLDLFYINSSLDRFKIIATKALTQTIGHFLKLLYFLLILQEGSEVTLPQIWPLVIVMAFLGTRGSKAILQKMSELNFRKYNKFLIYLISLLALYKGFNMF